MAPTFSDRDDFDASRMPALKLGAHILGKGFQGGAVVGTLAVAPGIAAWMHFREKQAVDPLRMVQGVGYSTLGFLGLTAVMGTLKLVQMDREGLEDRVYRLHYNQGQQRTDTFSLVGGVLGAAAAGLLLRDASNARPLHYLGGAGVGAAAGVLLHILSRPADQKSANKMLHELKY